MVFEITIEQVWNKFIEQEKKCIYTGLELIISNNRKICTASLDRIDSKKGYVSDNIQFVHKKINEMKWDYNGNDFIYWCKLVASHNN